jgi:hypothetical protein
MDYYEGKSCCRGYDRKATLRGAWRKRQSLCHRLSRGRLGRLIRAKLCRFTPGSARGRSHGTARNCVLIFFQDSSSPAFKEEWSGGMDEVKWDQRSYGL